MRTQHLPTLQPLSIGIARPLGAHGQGTVRGPQTNGFVLVEIQFWLRAPLTLRGPWTRTARGPSNQWIHLWLMAAWTLGGPWTRTARGPSNQWIHLWLMAAWTLGGPWTRNSEGALKPMDSFVVDGPFRPSGAHGQGTARGPSNQWIHVWLMAAWTLGGP